WRWDQIRAWPAGTTAAYAVMLALSGVLWAALVAAAAAPGAWATRALLALGAAFAVGTQHYFFARYHAYMNARAVLVGTSMLPSLGQQLWSDRVRFLRSLVPPVALACLLPFALRRVARVSEAGGRRALDAATAALLLAAFFVEARGGGEQGAPPDVLYLG